MTENTRTKPQDTNESTREYFNEILLEMRHIDAVVPNTELSLFGQSFQTPIMMAALSHLKGKEKDGMVEMTEGAKIAGAVNWVGMCENEQFAAIAAVDTPTIRIIKPYADESLVLSRIEQAEALGALAVGMDLDHAFNAKGQPDNVLGYPMRPRSFAEIKGYCARTKLPFIIKGVLSVQDAEKCLDAGVGGIVVSHHHGIMPTAVPPLMILSEIVKTVQNRFPIFVDCGIANGIDALKALALGAAAVSVGRPVMPAIQKSGAEGAAEVIKEITAELAGAMARTCSPDLSNIDASILWRRDGRRL